jgi:predicted CoA-substrate-specific enzyme activase
VDVGASATKLVLLEGGGGGARVLARVVRPSGIDYEATAQACLEAALAEAGLPPATPVRAISTGYGRRNVGFAERAVTELLAHGAGAFHAVPEAITVVDIGGQDNKVIHLDAEGRRRDFKMNRKCAAGTGAFIEEMALRLGVELSAMDGLARGTADAVRLSSFCTVFAKTEVLAHVRRGVPVAQIVRGVFQAVVQRVLEMDPLAGRVVLSGGVVAHNPIVAELLASASRREVQVLPQPQFAGALGAALELARAAAAEPGGGDDAAGPPAA